LKDNFKRMGYAAFQLKHDELRLKSAAHEEYLRSMVECGVVTLKGAQNQACMWIKQGAELDPVFLREELGILDP
jgi:hypothetical protein